MAVGAEQTSENSMESKPLQRNSVPASGSASTPTRRACIKRFVPTICMAGELVPHRDLRVVGVDVLHLAQQDKIRRVGFARSQRSINHHYPNTAIWEVVKQDVNH